MGRIGLSNERIAHDEVGGLRGHNRIKWLRLIFSPNAAIPDVR